MADLPPKAAFAVDYLSGDPCTLPAVEEEEKIGYIRRCAPSFGVEAAFNLMVEFRVFNVARIRRTRVHGVDTDIHANSLPMLPGLLTPVINILLYMGHSPHHLL